MTNHLNKKFPSKSKVTFSYKISVTKRSMDLPSIQLLTKSIIFYTPYIILIFSNIGCIGNFLTFTTKQLRQNSCGWYFLMSAVFDFLYINFGLFTKLASLQYGSSLIFTNITWCRIRVFLTWTLPCISTGFIILASIDRCLSTIENFRFHLMNKIKIAHRMTCIPIILYSLTTLHQLFYFQLQPICSPLSGIYSYFLSIYSMLWTNIIPQIILLIFGLITYLNIKKIHRSRKRIDFQLISLTLFQILFTSILLNIRTIYYSYTLLSRNIWKNSYRCAIENLFLEITSLIFYLNFGKSFYINTLTSKFFRKILQKRLLNIYRRKIRIHPYQN